MKKLKAYTLPTLLRLIVFLAALAALAAMQSCGNSVTTVADGDAAGTPAPWDLVEEGELPPATRHSYDLDGYADSLAADSAADAAAALLAEEDTDEEQMIEIISGDMSRFNGIGRLHELFNDSNKYQYAAATRIGIEPIRSLGEAYFTRRPLVKVSTNEFYTIESLTHSMPYLVPEAASLLETIGRNFRDSLRSKNMSGHKFRVTSLLRSAHSVKRLRRVNRNATDSSTHQLGTTFDISWSRFDHDGVSPRYSDAELKYVLAEVLRDLRDNRKCLVKYELKSPCFHITATGR